MKLGLSSELVKGAILQAIDGAPTTGLSENDVQKLLGDEQRPRTLRLKLRCYTGEIKYDHLGARWPMMVFANLLFPFFLVFSLPVFLAKSGSPEEFVLNAMAMIFIVTLDDIPQGERNAYTCSLVEDFAKSDVEDVKNPPPLPPRDPATEEPKAEDPESG